MNQRHKWADVLIAIAEGKPIEIRGYSNGQWRQWEDLKEHHCTPLTRNVEAGNVEWRIKPEKKQQWVAVGYAGCRLARKEDTRELAIQCFKNEYGVEPFACIEIEFEEGQGL